MNSQWNIDAARFLRSLQDPETGAARSTPQGPLTLYGACYSNLGLHYLGLDAPISDKTREFIASTQDPVSGLFIGPELVGFSSPPNATHDRQHLLLHLTCALLPFCQLHQVILRHKIHHATFFSEPALLKQWLGERDLRNAWLEGNNILFAGQMLVYLRNAEHNEKAQTSLDAWFDWLEGEIDPLTSLWGTNGYCEPAAGVYGGYHQLLVYWHEKRPIRNPQGLVDTVLSLRHSDGGFNPLGNGGACEDVDSVDILVHCYKRWDYRRAEIRRSLWHCVDHILSTQNADGGFPYNRDGAQSHMGIPGTEAAPNVSCTFPTWFRIHTLALCHEIIPEHPQLSGIPFRFSKHLSMGWHESPSGWKLEIPAGQVVDEANVERTILRERRMRLLQTRLNQARKLPIRVRRKLVRVANSIKTRLLGE